MSGQKPHYLGHRERLRERFKKTRGEGFQDYEWLELLLTYAIPRCDVKPIAKRLLDEFGSLSAVLKAPPERIEQVKGIGEITAMFFPLLKLISARYLDEELRAGESLSEPEAVVDYARTRLAGETEESFLVIYLDSGNRVLSSEMMGQGTPDEVKVYPRKIIKRALEINATRLILIHNHPSGVLKPSKGDLKLTENLDKAARTVGLKVLDHLIVSDEGYSSINL